MTVKNRALDLEKTLVILTGNPEPTHSLTSPLPFNIRINSFSSLLDLLVCPLCNTCGLGSVVTTVLKIKCTADSPESLVQQIGGPQPQIFTC